MSNATKMQLDELERLMSRMPRELCCTTLLPEFGVRWRDMAKAIRSARMSMTSASIARIVCRKVAKNLPALTVDEIIAKLRLQMVAIQSRIWHVINLQEPVGDSWEPDELPERLVDALTTARVGKNKSPEVQTVQIGDLVFVSVQLKSEVRCSAPLYLAMPLGLPVALVSSVKSNGVLQACVLGLGYKNFTDANLNGRHIPSLLRIHGGWDENLGYMTEIPKYDPVPIVTKTGIDYTNKAYDEHYVNTILGPDPPLLTDLHITTAKMFFNNMDNRLITIKAHLSSQNIAKTLKTLVIKGALRPTSELLHVLHTAKSNRLENYTESE
ncbi:PREDICTED: uncharacterized protein LOC106114715 [Papilio xuthus]|uniref:Uncharacterized protein LOC106114715 n=2 Tax=Papilio xuthus TaxID=66420 RepID=A0AAJ7E5H0_PAPXU|nr:PREDICTED: uncharacterized protein LOC106114715 [Papilio xuthus]